jgi:hypothetical protein
LEGLVEGGLGEPEAAGDEAHQRRAQRRPCRARSPRLARAPPGSFGFAGSGVGSSSGSSPPGAARRVDQVGADVDPLS